MPVSKRREHLLLTALGTQSNETTYTLNGKVAASSLSPIALMQLLPNGQRPDRIIALCTTAARQKTLAILRNGVNCPIEEVGIPNGHSREELWEIIKIIIDRIPHGSNLTLDLTQGFRSFPFLVFTAVLFLRALRNVDVRAVYYGMYVVENLSPMIDLEPVLKMVEWFYGTRMFKETGQAHLLSKLLKEFERSSVKEEQQEPYDQIQEIRKGIETVSSLYAQALPLETGLAAGDLLVKLNRPIPEHLKKQMPVPEEVFDALRQFISDFAISSKAKKNITLTKEELIRQARIIDTYFEKGFIHFAVGLVREWIISAIAFYRGYHSGKDWLSMHQGRGRVEKDLGKMWRLFSIGGALIEKTFSPAQKTIVNNSLNLAGYRNGLSHHGYKESDADLSGKIKEIIRQWREIKDIFLRGGKPAELKLELKLTGGGGCVLVSPLGMSKGLIFSALKHLWPDKLIAITSEEGAANLAEAIKQAGWVGEAVTVQMHDPFCGFGETSDLIEKVMGDLASADEVVVNITGGTTALQYATQRVFEHARSLRYKTRQVAMIDRRSSEEQKNNPFVLGEMVELNEFIN